MKRTISTFGLLFTSISAIVGSGWLFSAFFTAEFAGPAALLSWLIGGIAIIIIAFIFAELCTLLPLSGSSVRIPQFTHGTTVSFIFAWMIWISYLALMAIEVQATVQYISFYFPQLIANQTGQLSHIGYLVAIILMLLVSIINIYSIRWLIRCNSALTCLKIAIPLIVAIAILSKYFSIKHILHPAHSAFSPLGFHGILAALSTGGILFAFNGFKQAAEMAGEAKNPNRAIPIALIGSVLFCVIFYSLLQISFNSSITANNLSTGWACLNLKNPNCPFISIITQDNLLWTLPLIYFGAFIAPLAASLMYCGSAGRSLAGMGDHHHTHKPFFFQVISSEGMPINAILINFVFGICLFAPLPGWDRMMSFLTSLLAVTYAIGPVCLLALRYQLPKRKRTFKLPFVHIWSTIAFYICTLLAYFAGWNIISKMSIAILIALLVLIIKHLVADNQTSPPLNWRESIWLWPYFIGLTIISYIGDYGGGKALLSTTSDFIIIAIFCIVIMFLAVIFRLPDQETENYVAELNLERTTE